MFDFSHVDFTARIGSSRANISTNEKPGFHVGGATRSSDWTPSFWPDNQSLQLLSALKDLFHDE